MTHLIAFTGLKGSGKDTAAAGLLRGGSNFRKIAFAEPLKAMLSTLLQSRGCSVYDVSRYLEGDLKEEPTDFLMGRTPRHAMQTLGTEWGRGLIDSALWVDTFQRRVRETWSKGLSVVVTDVRFPNEVEAVHALGGVVYCVLRPGTVETGHPSEALVKSLNVDGELDNIYTTPGGFEYFIRDYFERQLEG